MEKRIKSSKYAPLYGILIVFITFLLNASLVVAAMTGKNYDLRAGMTAPETIYATHTVTDSVATNALREAAREKVPVVYRIDAERVRELNAQAEAFFTNLGSLRSYAITPETKGFSAVEWAQRLDAGQKSSFTSMTTPNLSETQLCAVLAAQESELKLLQNIVMPKLSTALNAGLAPESAQSVRDACMAEIEAVTGLSDTLKSVGTAVLQSCMQATYVEDVDATEIARNEASNAVESIRVKKGEPVVLEGDTINEAQMAILTDLDLVRPADASNAPLYGAVIALLLAFVLFAIYLAERAPMLLCDHKRLILVCLIYILSIGLFALTEKLNIHISLAMFTILLCAALIAPRLGLVISLLLGFSMALMSGETGAHVQFESLSVFASTLFAGCVAIFAFKNTENRASYISAGTIGGATGALCILALSLMREMPWGTMLANMGFFLSSCLISALLVVGSMTIWEKLFDAATPARLHELLNANHPLMKQMMAEAPGTYQHSMNVAALCEAAAQRIGANALLARVGASYHDVGKLRRPIYFAENQKKGVNIHDTLPPQESAAIITAHQRDGVTLLHKYKFPGAVIRIAGEHHGNSLVAYFYYKALKEDPQTQQKDYRYAGNKPSTAEAAILMLADSCEAAVRSLGDCTREARAEMIHKIIHGKMNDAENNLLSDCPLTIRQFEDIERSFNKTFNGIMHDRIEYPEDLEATKG